MEAVHLSRLKPPRKAAGQMDLLIIPSGNGADMRYRQDVLALLVTVSASVPPSSGDR
jgi:hypothetical protein